MEVAGIDEDQETKDLRQLAVSLGSYRAFRRDKEAEYLAAKKAEQTRPKSPEKELKIEEVFPAYREFEVENRLRQVIHELLEPMASITHDAKARLRALADKSNATDTKLAALFARNDTSGQLKDMFTETQ